MTPHQLNPSKLLALDLSIGIIMLLTDPCWADTHPTRLRLVQPYLPWRAIGMSTESPCFLVERAGPQQEEKALLSHLLVSTPEHLLKVVAELGQDCGPVYRLCLSGHGESDNRLERITSLMQYEAGGVPWFNTIGKDGQSSPCLPWQPKPEVGALQVAVWAEGEIDGALAEATANGTASRLHSSQRLS